MLLGSVLIRVFDPFDSCSCEVHEVGEKLLKTDQDSNPHSLGDTTALLSCISTSVRVIIIHSQVCEKLFKQMHLSMEIPQALLVAFPCDNTRHFGGFEDPPTNVRLSGCVG